MTRSAKLTTTLSQQSSNKALPRGHTTLEARPVLQMDCLNLAQSMCALQVVGTVRKTCTAQVL